MSIKKIFKKSESGQATVVIIIAVLIVGIFLVFQSKTTTVSHVNEACVINPPDSSRSIAYGGKRYNVIRVNSALATEQQRWHIQNLGQISFEGEQRNIYRFKTNAEAHAEDPRWTNQPAEGQAPVNFDADALKLLLVDMTNANNQRADGYIFVNIYLEENQEIPQFIEDFCGTNPSQPLSPLQVFPSGSGDDTFPPPRIRREQITLDGGGGDFASDYTLFSYEKVNSFAGEIHTTAGFPGVARIGSKTYPIRFVGFAGYVALRNEKEGIIYLYSGVVPTPTPATSAASRNSLQLGTFDVFTLYPWGWWSPECKPAVYLYPEKKTNVHVIVSPKGYLTYTDPVYPQGGWKVEANPDGTIVSSNKNYAYLYYESKIRDSEIEKPTKGYVVSFEELPALYSKLLPKLGLSEKETQDFKEYWEKVLPKSPYYFVGVMNEKSIDKIEPLQINPKPQTIVRVRLYFEALNEVKKIEEPEFTVVKRSGFVVSEWGGIVKLHPGTEFSCSQ